MKHSKHLSSAIFVVALVMGSWVSARAQSEITLLAPGPVRTPLDKIVANFEAKAGHGVRAA
jgi:ABC-type molybdate transport system substrate-binding protein